jgi:hypothetical protein
MMCLGEDVVNTKLRINIIRTKKEMGLQEVSRNIIRGGYGKARWYAGPD